MKKVHNFPILERPIGLNLAKYTVTKQSDRSISFQYSINRLNLTCHKYSTSTQNKELETEYMYVYYLHSPTQGSTHARLRIVWS